MSRFLRLSTATPSNSTASARARRSRGRSAIVDLVPLDNHNDNDNHFDFQALGDDGHDDDDDDDLAVVRPSPTPSPPDSPGRQLAEFYLGAASLPGSDSTPLDPTPSQQQEQEQEQEQEEHQLDQGLNDDLLLSPEHQAPAPGNDSLLDFPPTPSTAHSASNRSSVGSASGTGPRILHHMYSQPISPLSSSASAAARPAIPPPLPPPVQVQVQHQPDDDPFGFALVERRIQLTRPCTQSQALASASFQHTSKSPSVSVPPPSQRAPSSSLFFSSTPTQQSQQQQNDTLLLPHRPMSPLSSLHLTADTPLRDSLDPTLHPPPFSSSTPPPVNHSPPPPPPPPPTTSADPPPAKDASSDDDDEFFTFKPTSRAAQTHSRVSLAMQAALHPSTTSSAAAPSKKYTARKMAKTGPVARMAKNKDKDVFDMDGDGDDDNELTSAAAAVDPNKRKKKPVAPRKPRGSKKPAAGPTQVTRFLGELIGVPSSSPPHSAQVPPPRVAPADKEKIGQEEDSGSDFDAHPIAKPAPGKKKAAAPALKKRGTAAAAAKKLVIVGGTENVDPFALPDEEEAPAAKSKPRAGRGAKAVAPAPRKKRSSAERVSDAEDGQQREEQGSPRKRTRTAGSESRAAAGSAADTSGAEVKRVARPRRGAAAATAEVEE